ncbi:hypothetical protein VNO78_17681 [Psophocarpus tetragonolobus]|uniref:Uncharacterized protein n=1 Tax=Psophocarpus tetragonolobus TaxID=3891 RepID=A0AAN9SI67_PSOTE
MKLIAFFIVIILVRSCLGESSTSGIGGIYGQQQRNRLGRGKVIENIEKEKTNIYSPKSSAESSNHHAWPKENNNDVAGTSQEDGGNRNEDGKFKHRVVHA